MISVLVVDDMSDARTLARAILEDRGHTVHEASTGDEVFRVLHDQQVDVMLLDVRMPGLNGWDVLERIRDEELLDLKRIALFSANAEPNLAERARAEGVYGYLEKTFRYDDLVAYVENIDQSA